MMYWKLVSFDKTLSERKNPSSSEESLERLQNCRSVSSAGTPAAARPTGIGRTAMMTQTMIKHAAAKIRRCRWTGRWWSFMGADLNTQLEIHHLAGLWREAFAEPS